MTSYNLSGTPKPDSEIVHLKNGKTRVTKPKTARPKIPELIKSKDESELKGTKFQWKIKKLQSMKNKLNKIKSPLDIINSNKKGRYAYRMIVRESGYYEDIRGADGLIVEEYGAEVVTNAWLKFWEILHVYFRDYLDDKDKHHPEFNTFHVAEAPGNFILCLNHFISKNNLAWTWLAESYVPDSSKGTLGDDYKLIQKNPKKWLLGIENNGDICSSANIRSFMHSIPKHINTVDMYTADGKIETHDHSEEEKVNLRILYGQVFGCLATLSTGGHAVIKAFTTFEAPTISLLYLMRLVFWELHLFKPKTSRGANSEIYIVAKDYRGINQNTLKKLLIWYDDISENVITEYALFKQEDIDTEFLEKIVSYSEKRTNLQKKYLERNFQIYQEYAVGNKLNKLIPDMTPMRKKCAKKWLKKYDICELDIGDAMLADY